MSNVTKIGLHERGPLHLAFYTKSFQFVHNHRHYGLNGRFVATLAMVLDRFDGMRA